jgi:hypothetical protein
MSTHEINSLGRGVETYNLHSSCAFFVKVDYFRFARELPNTPCARSHTKQNQGASLRNFKIGEVAFRAGPYKQGHRALRIAKLHIVDSIVPLKAAALQNRVRMPDHLSCILRRNAFSFRTTPITLWGRAV